MVTAVRRRFDAMETDGLAERLRLRIGTRQDYDALAEHHYRARQPATVTRVLVLEDTEPTVASRFAGLNEPRGLGGTPRGVDGVGWVVAVLVESLPSLSCRMRDYALRDRYGTHLSPGERALLLNAEVRCISRVVVDPRWRGSGLAVRLVRHALRTATTPVTEALAAMGRVHPFFERAGMTAYPRPTHDYDARLLAAMRFSGVDPDALGDLVQTWRIIESLPPRKREWLLKELRSWYRKNGGRSGGYERGPRKQLRTARERLGLEPVYYVHVREQT